MQRSRGSWIGGSWNLSLKSVSIQSQLHKIPQITKFWWYIAGQPIGTEISKSKRKEQYQANKT